MTPDPSQFWAILTVAGPIALGLALLWATLHYRRRRKRGKVD